MLRRGRLPRARVVHPHRVTCHARTDGRHRSIIQLRSGAGVTPGSVSALPSPVARHLHRPVRAAWEQATSSGGGATGGGGAGPLAALRGAGGGSKGRGGPFEELDVHMECLEAFVCVVTPRCVVEPPVCDLGVTFVGVQVRACVCAWARTCDTWLCRAW
jgi:hypothetical protein